MRAIRLETKLLLTLLACVTTLAQGQRPILMPRIQAIGQGVVWRVSNRVDQQGSSLPSWKQIQVTNIFGFKKRPAIGEKVTVIPLDVNISPLDLRIIKTRRGANCGGSDSSVWWEVELEPVKRKDFFEISSMPKRREEYPFDVAVIYPAVKFARQVKKNRLTKDMLPKGVAIKTVKGAIDLTGDGIPDVLIVEHCCSNARKAPEECDYTCGKTFRKFGNAWKLVDTSAPC